MTTRDEIEAAVDALENAVIAELVTNARGSSSSDRLESRAALLSLVSPSCDLCRHLGSDSSESIIACRYCLRNAEYHDHWEATP